MTKKEAYDKLKAMAKCFGYELDENLFGVNRPGIVRHQPSYIDFIVREREPRDEYNPETETGTCYLEVTAFMCRINPNADEYELMRASEEIQNGAIFVMAVKNADLCWSTQL